MKIELDFKKEEIELLCNTRCWSFVKTQKGRFEDYINGGKSLNYIYKYESNKKNIVDYYNPNGEIYYKSSLDYCDDFLSVKIYYEYHKNKGVNCFILHDENADYNAGWCLWVDKPLYNKNE